MIHFIDKCINQIRKKNSPLIVGLDPHFNLLPDEFKAKFTSLSKAGQALFEFNKSIIDALEDLIPAIKPQIAFYEKYGLPGLKAYQNTIEYAHKRGLLVIGDIKRSDIGSTVEAYADAHLGEIILNGKKYRPFSSDAVTVNPYLGSDGIGPFVENSKKYGRGIFILVKTSNKSSIEIQDQILLHEGGELKLYEHVGGLVNEWGSSLIGQYGYSSIGAVVGATFPDEIKRLRRIMPHAFFLIPGIGAQGGSIKNVIHAFDFEGLGALINVSRSVIFAYQNSTSYSSKKFDLAAREEVIKLNNEFRQISKF